MRQQSQGVLGLGKRSSYDNLMDPSVAGSSGKKPHPVRKASYAGNHPLSIRNGGNREGGSIRNAGNRESFSKPTTQLRHVSSHQNNTVDLVGNVSGSRDVSHRSTNAYTDSVPFSGSSHKKSNLLSTNVGGTSGVGSAEGVFGLLELTSAEASLRLFNRSGKSDNPLPPLIIEKSMLKDSTGSLTSLGTPSNILSSTTYTIKHSNVFGSENASPVEAFGRQSQGLSQKHENAIDSYMVSGNMDNTTSAIHNNPSNLWISENAPTVVSTHVNSRNHSAPNGTTTGNAHINSNNNSHNNSHSNSRSNSRPGSRNGSFVKGSGDFLVAMEEGQQHTKKGDTEPHLSSVLLHSEYSLYECTF